MVYFLQHCLSTFSIIAIQLYFFLFPRIEFLPKNAGGADLTYDNTLKEYEYFSKLPLQWFLISI